jgi:hypothetical protein
LGSGIDDPVWDATVFNSQRVEERFGCIKTVAGLRQHPTIGARAGRLGVHLTAAACKLVRLPKLSAAAWPGCIALLADAEYHR